MNFTCARLASCCSPVWAKLNIPQFRGFEPAPWANRASRLCCASRSAPLIRCCVSPSTSQRAKLAFIQSMTSSFLTCFKVPTDFMPTVSGRVRGGKGLWAHSGLGGWAYSGMGLDYVSAVSTGFQSHPSPLGITVPRLGKGAKCCPMTRAFCDAAWSKIRRFVAADSSGSMS